MWHASPFRGLYYNGAWAFAGSILLRRAIIRISRCISDTRLTHPAAIVAKKAPAAGSQRFADIGLEAFPRDQQTSEAPGAFVAEFERWWPIVKAANIKGE